MNADIKKIILNCVAECPRDFVKEFDDPDIWPSDTTLAWVAEVLVNSPIGAEYVYDTLNGDDDYAVAAGIAALAAPSTDLAAPQLLRKMLLGRVLNELDQLRDEVIEIYRRGW